MAAGANHRMVIERRGRSHKAVCSCSWTGHAWNELRPAEADAWHHLYGDEVIVDVSVIPDERSVAAASTAVLAEERTQRTVAVEHLVHDACALAAGPSPFMRGAAPDLWRRAGGDRMLVQEAINEIGEMLSRHDRQSAGAADSEWLTLITAKRLLSDALSGQEERRPSRA